MYSSTHHIRSTSNYLIIRYIDLWRWSFLPTLRVLNRWTIDSYVAPQLANTPGQLLKKVAQATPKGLLHLFVLVLLLPAVEVLFFFMLIFFVVFSILLLCYVERSRLILLQISPLSTLGRDDRRSLGRDDRRNLGHNRLAAWTKAKELAKKLIFSEKQSTKNSLTVCCGRDFLTYPFTNFLHG